MKVLYSIFLVLIEFTMPLVIQLDCICLFLSYFIFLLGRYLSFAYYSTDYDQESGHERVNVKEPVTFVLFVQKIIACGIPQWSVSGSLQFLFYNNNLSNAQKSKIMIYKYA